MAPKLSSPVWTPEDEIRLLVVDDGGEEVGFGTGVEKSDIGEIVVPDAEGPVGTFREGLTDGLVGVLGADSDRDDLVGEVGLLELDGLLDGVVVPLVQVSTEILVSDCCPVDLESVFDGGDFGNRNEDLHRYHCNVRAVNVFETSSPSFAVHSPVCGRSVSVEP